MITKKIVIVGGGPAGMAAAVSAFEAGVPKDEICLLDRGFSLGGILVQCIHNGFGLKTFGEELTGPEYADKFAKKIYEYGIEVKTDTIVTSVGETAGEGGEKHRVVTAQNNRDGVFKIDAGAVILAMGCRERSRGALNIPGTRPAGIYTAGTAQRYVNVMGYMPGRRVVILGSGDIGLIMARRMTLEGAKVLAVCELMPYSGGLTRNIVQCLNDFDIPLMLSHTVVDIEGKDRVTGVTVAQVDESRKPIPGTEKHFDCDTLLLSVGLLPENELTRTAGIEIDRLTGGAVVDQNRQTSIAGIFAAGNVLHVHDLADFASEEAAVAGVAAAKFANGTLKENGRTEIVPGDGVRYTVPQHVSHSGEGESVKTYFRVTDVQKDVYITVKDENGASLLRRKARRVAPGEMEFVV
ncbi:MAG: FAD-dependent oxidoreductase, partial [Clostridia bacterium]|nr:FAD-dependent oxidoreductase [Clostridia bacterium]